MTPVGPLPRHRDHRDPAQAAAAGAFGALGVILLGFGGLIIASIDSDLDLFLAIVALLLLG
jgi:hypothetical protein